MGKRSILQEANVVMDIFHNVFCAIGPVTNVLELSAKKEEQEKLKLREKKEDKEEASTLKKQMLNAELGV